MDRVPYIDQSGLFALEDVLMDLNQKNIDCLMVGVKSQPKHLMKSIQIIDKLIPEDRLFESFEDCKNWVVSKQTVS